MITKLEKWKTSGKLKGQFILQEAMEGVEMAVGGWFGPGGWNRWKSENWEEKRLFNKGLGPNTGEMGTIARYVKKSKLFDEVLLPVSDALWDLGYVGYCDVNCIIGDDGTPWPLEFTMRPGWPHFQLCQALTKGDRAQWMLDLVQGKDSLECETDICVGVVMVQGDFPWGKIPVEDVSDFPITGVSERIHLSTAKWGPAPEEVDGGFYTIETYLTAGDEVGTVMGLGKTVKEAQKDVYKNIEEIHWCNDPFYRTDIGERLKENLPKLQKLGYAKGMTYGSG
jgi:phosphoribosylamine--glycine ligase